MYSALKLAMGISAVVSQMPLPASDYTFSSLIPGSSTYAGTNCNISHAFADGTSTPISYIESDGSTGLGYVGDSALPIFNPIMFRNGASNNTILIECYSPGNGDNCYAAPYFSFVDTTGQQSFCLPIDNITAYSCTFLNAVDENEALNATVRIATANYFPDKAGYPTDGTLNLAPGESQTIRLSSQVNSSLAFYAASTRDSSPSEGSIVRGGVLMACVLTS